GMPIGAFVANKAVMDVIKENPILGHITTFGGHPVSCAAALASLNVILDNRLTADVQRKANLFRQHLQHPRIREIRGIGLMHSLQLHSFAQVETVSKYCAEQGVIVDWFLHCDTAMRIAPPLTINDNEIEMACKVILDGITDVG